MKFYYPKNKNGEVIGFKTPESQVYDATGKTLTSKLQEKADKSTTTNIQSQLNALVLETSGDSNAEVVQARVGQDGTTYETLKERLDTEQDSIIKIEDSIVSYSETGIITKKEYIDLQCEQGTMYLPTGEKSDSTTRIRSVLKLSRTDGFCIEPNGMKYAFTTFTKDGDGYKVYNKEDWSDKKREWTPNIYLYYDFIFAKKDDSEITPSENTVRLYKKVNTEPYFASNKDLNSLNDDIDAIRQIRTFSIIDRALVIGRTIDSKTGITTDWNPLNRFCSETFMEREDGKTIAIKGTDSNYNVSIRYYDSSYNYLGYEGWNSSPVRVLERDDYKYFKLVYRKSDDSNIDSAEQGPIANTFTIGYISSLIETTHSKLLDKTFIDLGKRLDADNDILDSRLCKIESLTACGEYNITSSFTFEQGSIKASDGTKINSGTGNASYEKLYQTRIRTTKTFIVKKNQMLKLIPNGQKFNIIFYNMDGKFVKTYNPKVMVSVITTIIFDDAYKIKITVANTDDSAMTPSDSLLQIYELLNNNVNDSSVYSHINNLKSMSIVCAKEKNYTDGTPPKIEWYLLEEPGTKKYYISTDLVSKKYAFTFSEPSYKYCFGVTNNNDIIAVRDSETLGDNTKDDNQRTNPYVWLASENYEFMYTVDFGDSLKPCGWLSSAGFRNLPDGTSCIAEYTRMTVATANAWKLQGDITKAENWVLTEQFQVTTTDNNNGFKHCHAIMYDHYTKVTYLLTGDSDEGAKVLYSTDYGATWIMHMEGSEKYCRIVSISFTKDYVYWAGDTDKPGMHWLFKAPRNSVGVIDKNNIIDYVEIYQHNQCATYGTVYLQELNCIVLLDRQDVNNPNMPFRVIDLETNKLIDVATLEPVNNVSKPLGFRTRFTQWYTRDGIIRLGFGFKKTGIGSTVNYIKGFGNAGEDNETGLNNVNNLTLKVTKCDGKYNLIIDTIVL